MKRRGVRLSGQIVMEKVKVNRYVAGKRPEYANETDESDSELEIENRSRPRLTGSVTVNYAQIKEEETKESSDEEVEPKMVEDPRFKRLMQLQRLQEEDDAKIARHREVHLGGQEVKVIMNRMEDQGLGSSDDEADAELSDEEIHRRRAELRLRVRERMKAEELAKEEIGAEESSVEEEESEYEECTDSESEAVPRLKPVFVSKRERATLLDAAEEQRLQEEAEAEEKQKQEERRAQTVKMVEELLRLEVEQESTVRDDDKYDLDSILTDDENEELAYEMWKVRELKRIKRDREEREAYDKEKAEIQRVHNMTEEERRAYLRANPKIITNKQNKGKYKFLQKYFHRGVFFLDQEDEVYKRNFAEPTLEDHFDRTLLPKVMQVKDFGKAGRTKWTHLVAEDTTDFQSPWVADTIQNMCKIVVRSGRSMDSDFEITEFMDEGKGFDCVFKQRFQDFIVREIDPCGNIVTLTTMEAPEVQVTKCETVPLDSVFESDIADRLLQLDNGELTEVKIECSEKSKDERAKMHKCIRQFFQCKLESSTVSDQNETSIVVRRADVTAKRGNRKRKFWPHQQQGDYCTFVLYKENKDTQAAIASIAKKLNIKPGHISVAGNKDRRAVTSQLASVYRIEASQLLSLNRYLRSIKVGNCSYKKNSIFVGNLSGNRFSIVLRNVDKDVAVVSSCVERLDRIGFINYYGAQRFGTTNIPTYKVGRCILLKQWEQAVDLILAPKGTTDDDMEAARHEWAESKNASAALEKISRHLRYTSVEGMLLAALKKGSKNNYAMALKGIPRNMLNLYLHSYQSLLWNRLVSRRIQHFGIRTIPGDLIQTSGTDEASVLSEEQMDNVSIYDVCLPIFSQYAKLPDNECAKLYEEILKEENLEPATFGDLHDQFHVRGGLRKVFVRPADLKYRFASYDDPTVPLVPTDLEVVEGREPAQPTGEKFLALIIEFSLPAGCYATMALRELCREVYPQKKEESLLADELSVFNWLRAYFEGRVDDLPKLFENMRFCCLVGNRNGISEFAVKVYKQLCAIPYGNTIHYSEIAAKIGQPKAARAVGGAVSTNPVTLIIPCHRVTPKTGITGRYSHGKLDELKRTLLRFEACRLKKTFTNECVALLCFLPRFLTIYCVKMNSESALIPLPPKKSQNSLLWLSLACEKKKAPAIDVVEAPLATSITVHKETAGFSRGVKKQRIRRKRKEAVSRSNAELLEKSALQVRQFAITSMKGEEKESHRTKLAVLFGAKPAKRPYVNYKELKVQRQLQEAKRLEALKQMVNIKIKRGKNKKGKKKRKKVKRH
ncbi:hypothetical protein M514_09117 [Trichuris suis]|uniref:Methylated-DNA--protein-cysteine methyltransferase n=1 Tax=Trichuris suis TaxID=68888 RepID=A0A085N5L1_9BILA|nr:hypothetical protein M514_09117 [Trichuris suis]